MDPDRVIRYLTGRMSADEAAEMRAWLEADPARLEQVRVIEAALQRAFELPEADESVQSWERVASRIRERKTIPLAPRLAARGLKPPRRPAVGRSVVWLRRAAMIAVLIGGAALWKPAREWFFTEPPVQSHTTAAGQRGTLTLSDGSRIMIGPESELRFPSRSRRGAREVQLDGTAYFEVARDPRRPFLVHAGGAVTRVLGTRFVVRAYADEEAVEVAVSEGSVAVESPAAEAAEAVTLASGERARVDAGRAPQRIEGSIEALFGWTEGRLVFRDARVSAVLRELERWYDVDIRLTDPATLDRAVTISFDGDPLDEAIALFAATLGVRLDRDDRTVVLTPSP